LEVKVNNGAIQISAKSSTKKSAIVLSIVPDGASLAFRVDGVEVLQFTKPGTFLLICSRKNHFIDQDTQQFKMFGFVKVLSERKKD